MNTTIQKINSIIDDFDKEYVEWMDKKEASMEEEMQIFKKHYFSFQDLYDENDENDEAVENDLFEDILIWISDTIGEIYVNWGTESNDYYNPGLTLKSIVEKYTKGK